MDEITPGGSRRRFLAGTLGGTAAALAARFFDVKGAFAQELDERRATPEVEEGPFYPDKLPRDTDNDLLVLNDSSTPALGEVTHLSGKVLDKHGDPVRNATLEIWQVDHHGAYIHSQSGSRENRDKNFQGFGRFLTSSSGAYYFRTIKPVPYPGRTPHIHMKVYLKGKEVLTTQVFVKGHEQNRNDGVLHSIREKALRDLVQVDFAPDPGSSAGELAAKFDVVLGVTPRAADWH